MSKNSLKPSPHPSPDCYWGWWIYIVSNALQRYRWAQSWLYLCRVLCYHQRSIQCCIVSRFPTAEGMQDSTTGQHHFWDINKITILLECVYTFHTEIQKEPTFPAVKMLLASYKKLLSMWKSWHETSTDLTQSWSGSALPEKTNHALAEYKEAEKLMLMF